jgi:hypothetical protein
MPPIKMMDGIEKNINERDVRGDVPVVGNKPRRKMRETHVRRAIVDRVHFVPRCTGRSGPKCLFTILQEQQRENLEQKSSIPVAATSSLLHSLETDKEEGKGCRISR